jgi:hypothetical protein
MDLARRHDRIERGRLHPSVEPDRDVEAEEIDYRTAAIALAGKVRGSRARRLGEALAALAEDGYDQVVLDVRALGSLDSLGALALEEALAAGQRLLLVLDAGRGHDAVPAAILLDGRVRAFARREDAVAEARAREDASVFMVV